MTTRLRTDRFLVVDLEMTCWEGPPPEDESPEIIEIGIVEIDAQELSVTRSRSLLVRPRHSSVSAFCTELTGITPEALKEKGRPLAEVLRSLAKEFGPGRKAWMAWGSDKAAVESDCVRAAVPSPFSDGYVDMGLVFGTLLGRPERVGLTAAMEIVGITPVGREHSGLDDAMNAARVWIELARHVRSLNPSAAAGLTSAP